MYSQKYARWMYEWETRLTTRDENRVVRPLEWGFEWIEPFLREHGFDEALPGPEIAADPALAEAAMVRINQFLIRHSDSFFGYQRPTDFRLEERHPELFPTNVRPETLAQDAAIKQQAAEGKIPPAQFLRFTSPERTPYPENDLVNARWYPAPAHKDPQRPKQAIMVMPQWNADAFSHNSLCTIFNKMGISALRLSKPYHDIRRPARAGALRLRRQRQHRPHALGLPPGGGRYSLLPGLAGGAGLRALRRAGNQPGLLLRLPGQRPRRAAAGECLQPCVDGLWRRGLGGAEHAPRQAGAGRGRPHSGAHARLVGSRQPVQLLRQDRAPRSRRPAEESPAGLRRLRPDLPQGVLAAGGARPSSASASTSRSACCPAATTPPARRPTSTSTAGTWAGLSTGPSRRCARRRPLAKG